jgi:hypothetical protein
MATRALARPYQARQRPEQRYQTGRWRGMFDSTAAHDQHPDFAGYAGNVYLADWDTSSPRWVGLPGTTLLGAQLGSGGARTFQAIGSFTTTVGVTYRIGICGGKFYTYDYGGNLWTETLTAAHLAAASVTLSTTAMCALVPYANTMVVSDGVNTAWAWDGTSGGGITKLTNAPVFYGVPWVYNGLLMGIKNSAPNTIVWSEPGELNTGYEAGGYNNAWDLRQTSNDAVVAGAGTNDYIVIFRQTSITLIRGDVTPNFSSTGTDEGVDEHVGTRSPYSIVKHDLDVYFFSSDRRIMRVRAGVAEDMSAGFRDTLTGISVSQMAIVQGTVRDLEQQGERVVMGLPVTGATALGIFCYVNPHTGGAESVQTGFQCQRLGTWRNANGDAVMVHGGGASAATSADGYAYDHGLISGSARNYGFQAGAAAITHSVSTAKLGYDLAVEKRWWRIDATVIPRTSMTGIGIQITTSRGTESFMTSISLNISGAVYDTAIYGTDVYASAGEERHLPSCRPAATSRWAQVTYGHATLGEAFELCQVAATAMLLDNRSEAY